VSRAINYEKVLNKALVVLYPDARKRSEIQEQLQSYGTETFHREVPRVSLAILYLTSQEPERFADFLDLARTDYRDLLCAAEYPHSSRQLGLMEKDPKEFKKLEAKERAEYLAWIDRLESA
jgi:hypothetical protein